MSEIMMNEETLDTQVPSVLPLLALRDVVVYPHMQIALFVGREKSINAVDVARNSNNLVFVVAQQDSLTEEIDHDNLYQYGTVAKIVQVVNHENDENCIKVLIEGLHRSKLKKIIDEVNKVKRELGFVLMALNIRKVVAQRAENNQKIYKKDNFYIILIEIVFFSLIQELYVPDSFKDS